MVTISDSMSSAQAKSYFEKDNYYLDINGDINMEDDISEAAAARMICVAAGTLLNWRKNGLVPEEIYTVKKYLSGAIRVKYKKGALLSWSESYNLTGDDNKGI